MKATSHLRKLEIKDLMRKNFQKSNPRLDWQNFIVCFNVLLDDLVCRALLKELINRHEELDECWIDLKLAEIEKELRSQEKL